MSADGSVVLFVLLFVLLVLLLVLVRALNVCAATAFAPGKLIMVFSFISALNSNI